MHICAPCCVLLKNVSFRNAAMLFLYRLAAEMTFSVTFAASLFETQFGNFCDRSEYVTVCIISATIMREVTLCVTFGAPRSGFPLVSCRRPTLAHMANFAHGEQFGQHANVFRCVFVVGAGFWRQRMPRRKRRREHHCLALFFSVGFRSAWLRCRVCRHACALWVGHYVAHALPPTSLLQYDCSALRGCGRRPWIAFALWFRKCFALSLYGVFFSKSLNVLIAGGRAGGVSFPKVR